MYLAIPYTLTVKGLVTTHVLFVPATASLYVQMAFKKYEEKIIF